MFQPQSVKANQQAKQDPLNQEALRWHEGANTIGQRIGELECAERGRVARKNA